MVYAEKVERAFRHGNLAAVLDTASAADVEL